jgi:hypothetical protein
MDMEIMQRGILSRHILVIILLTLIISAVSMVTLIRQSKASENDSTTDIISNTNTLPDGSKATSDNIVSKAIGNSQVSGSGSGEVTCPDGKQVSSAEVSFAGFMSKVPLYGSWEVIAVSSGSGNSINKGGSFHSGSIGTDQFSLKGNEIRDKICGIGREGSDSSTVQTTATLSGQCGQGVTIELNADNGERGTFNGDTDCKVVGSH